MFMIAKAVRNFAALALIAMTALPHPTAAQTAQKAKVGVLRLSSSAPVFIAQDKGYFREAGLDIELKFFDAAQPIAVAVTSGDVDLDRKSTRLNSSHANISYAVFCLKKKNAKANSSAGLG